MPTSAPIRILRTPIVREELALYLGRPFTDMIKFVVDIDRRIIAVGGEMNADAEEVLLDAGSAQAALWGGNYDPGRGELECLEYGSLINIRPTAGDPSMEVLSDAVRGRMRDVVFALLGRGEALP